jgi:CDP-diacylglycerol--serine O-phosphatidyltransferase
MSFLNVPCALTAASLAGGFLALILAVQGELYWAMGVVVTCAVLDSLDGLLARRMSQSSPFGAELDSLADMVAFGVAPALMLYTGVLHEIPVAGAAVCVAYVLSGAWRLARFALVADDWRFLGLPIPPSAMVLVGTLAWEPPAFVALLITAALCLLMVSDIPFPTFRMIGRLMRPPRRRRQEESTVMMEVDLVELEASALSGSPSSAPRG